jgi:hypothetical protein
LSGLIVCGTCGRRYHGDSRSYLCSTSRTSNKPGRCSSRRVREAPLIAAIDELVQKQLGTPAATAALRRKIEERLAAAKKTAADEGPGLRKRLESLDRQLSAGAARLLEVPPGLVPELAKALEAVRGERDALASKLEATGNRRPAEPTPKAIVDQVMSFVRDLKKAAQEGDPALINHCFRRLGVQIVIKRNDRKAAEATVKLLLIGDLLESLECSQQVTITHFVEENVALPPAMPPGFAKGNKFGRGLPSDKARAASLARWRKQREAQTRAATKAAGRAKRSRRPAASR